MKNTLILWLQEKFLQLSSMFIIGVFYSSTDFAISCISSFYACTKWFLRLHAEFSVVCMQWDL